MKIYSASSCCHHCLQWNGAQVNYIQSRLVDLNYFINYFILLGEGCLSRINHYLCYVSTGAFKDQPGSESQITCIDPSAV